jgi:hypothetical protein
MPKNRKIARIIEHVQVLKRVLIELPFLQHDAMWAPRLAIAPHTRPRQANTALGLSSAPCYSKYV